jgi:hypothetical protein
MKYRVSFYTLSDCHSEKEIEATDRPALMAQLDKEMIDLSAPYTITELGDNKPMTTPTPTTPAQQAAEQFRADLRADLAEIMDELHSQRAEIINVRADLEAIRAGLTQASQPAPAVGTFGEMMIDNIIMTYDDKGKAAYKATGTPYNKFGVRVWPETLPALGIDPISLRPGPNPQQPAIRARVLMNEPEEGKTAQPRKVTGKA